MEVWRDVIGYEGAYQVSNFGRVRRVKGGKGSRAGKVLRPGTSRAGVRNVVLCVQSRPQSRAVHRIVALAFLGSPPSDRHQVAHCDGNPSNNRLANLRWATPAENSFDQVLHGTQKGKHHGRLAALTDEQVLAIRADHRTESEIAPDYGLSPRTIGQIRRRQTYKHLPARPGDYVPIRNSMAFSDDQVRALRTDPRPSAQIADEYGCSAMAIWALRTRRTYAHVADRAAEPRLETAAAPEQEFNRVYLVGDTLHMDLPKGKKALFDRVDEAFVRSRRWGLTKGKYTYYVTSRTRDSTGRVNTTFLHRGLMDPPEGMVVDHINGDGLDNRRENLRIVTVAQNNLNSRVRRDSQSGLKGAFYDSRKGTYYSRIKTDSGSIGLGTFATAEEAAEAYAKASARYHGEFGRTYLDD